MIDVQRPRYPIYIPSKGRASHCLTALALRQDNLPFFLVVEPTELADYAAVFGRECVLMLPFHDLHQGSIPARNWIKAHATAAGHVRHWQIDDNIRAFYRRYQGKRIRCQAGIALSVTENFVDRYTNIGVAGLSYRFFMMAGNRYPPFFLNCHVYSCSLILNALPFEWRGRYNEDTDYCLQVLSAGWCTVAMNAFLADKTATMIMKGGNTDQLYQGDGRLKMARSLERMWPGVVTTQRRFQRPQHVVRNAWRGFDTPLIRRTDIDWSQLTEAPDEHGMELVQVKPEVKSPALRQLVAEYQSKKTAK